MTMIQYMSDTGLLPGTTHDISMIAAKLGIQRRVARCEDQSSERLGVADHVQPAALHGRAGGSRAVQHTASAVTNDVDTLTNALWYPPNSSTADVRPWDANGMQTPRAHGDYNANTATDYGLMLAYNQFSSNPSAGIELAWAGWAKGRA